MDISDIHLAPQGDSKIAWAQRAMPVLRAVAERWQGSRPLAGLRISACMHVTAETAVLMRTLAVGGAQVRLCASNPLSTQDDVAAGLVAGGIPVLAIAGEDRATYFRHLSQALEHRPQLLMDDGADLTTLVHTEHPELGAELRGGTEETTTGVTRLRSMAADGVLRFPMVAVNDADTKHLFDNRYGTGQSTIDGILRATNRLLAGACFVVCGYGWCGRGLAARAAGMGARVIVTEVDPVRALEAVMDGYAVMPIERAAELGDFFCTVTGNEHVIGPAAFARMKDGAVIANAGHFDVELDLEGLAAETSARRRIRPSLEELELTSGKRLYLLAEGRLVNLAAAEGHPADVMDLSFATQALTVAQLGRGELAAGVHRVPTEIDAEVARLKLAAMGVELDRLSDAQQRYLGGWRTGT
ncbi:MAG: adenosylhomocysteinase [Myxococcales bacterium]|nr:adenosylhomocysteinase [Myxococcales bacterium]